MNFFSDAHRKDPFPAYKILRELAHLQYLEPPWDAYLVSRYDDVRQVLSDHANFSSAMVPAPPNWSPIFSDGIKHARDRHLLTEFLTRKYIAHLEPLMREICDRLLDEIPSDEPINFAAEFAVPFPLKIIARIIGIPHHDLPLLRDWSDALMELSVGRSGGVIAQGAFAKYIQTSTEMNAYLDCLIFGTNLSPDTLLARLATPESGLTVNDILGMIQVLVIAGQDTFSNWMNNAMIALAADPNSLEWLHDDWDNPDLLLFAIEELFRYRSPLQWMPRVTRAPVELAGQVLPAGKLVLAMIGSANHDPKYFTDPDKLDISRQLRNPHLAFGCGIHSCLGATLARLEARVALEGILTRWRRWEVVGDWEPRPALHVLGPVELPLRLVK